jgi:hypothetical protein
MAENSGLRPDQGAVVQDTISDPSFSRPGVAVQQSQGGQTPWVTGEGLIVKLKRSGKTKRGVLKSPYIFQVPPTDELAINNSFAWSNYETVGKGQFTRPQGRQLITVSFTTLVVDWDATWTLVKAGAGLMSDGRRDRWKPDPQKLTRELRSVLRSGTPFHLIISQPELWRRPELDIAAVMTSLRTSERAGEVDARYIDVSFTEYRGETVKRRRQGEKLPTRHKIGDAPPKNPQSLRTLAKHYYNGKSQRWRWIAEANDIRNFDPDRDVRDLKDRKDRKLKKLVIPASVEEDEWTYEIYE